MWFQYLNTGFLFHFGDILGHIFQFSVDVSDVLGVCDRCTQSLNQASSSSIRTWNEVKAWATASARPFWSLKTYKGEQWRSEHRCSCFWGRSSRDMSWTDCNPHSLSLQYRGGGGGELSRKVKTAKKGQVGRSCFKFWVYFLLSYSDFIGNKLI